MNVMTTLPSFSIVLTCYNLEKYVGEALKSIFNQDYTGEMELIVVDDASTDNSISVINETIATYGLGWKVIFIQNKTNIGVAASTDVGWEAASNEWIIEADGDDVQLADRCSVTAQLINKYPKAELIYLSQICIDETGKEIMRRYMVNSERQVMTDYLAESVEDRVGIFLGDLDGLPVRKGGYGCSTAIKKTQVLRWGRLVRGDSPRFAQDPPWELRVFLSGPVAWGNQFACLYRSHSTNLLNRSRRSVSLSDRVNNELFFSKYAIFESNTQQQMLADIERALDDGFVSDWSKENLERCRKYLETKIFTLNLKSTWFQRNIFSRLYAALKYRKRVSKEYSRWFIYRVLPLRWSMMLKAIMRR